MFSNILKWTFKIAVDGIEKEYNLHLDGDSPLQAIEQVGMQMIAHCAKVKEAQAAAQAAVEKPAETVAEPAPVEPIDSVLEGNQHV
jgi:hypothetical protein